MNDTIMQSLSGLSSKLHLRHKILLIICLTLSVYTLITSQTMSSLMAFRHHFFAANDRQLIDANWERRRGVRTTDLMGRLLYYHLPNLTDYHIIYYYTPLTTTTTTTDDDDQHYCHTSTTDWNRTSKVVDSHRCVCVEGYGGADCGIPSVVSDSLQRLPHFDTNTRLTRLSKPKRLVLSVILYTNGHQLDVQYINNTLKSLSHFVDLFIITKINLIDSQSGQGVKCGPNVDKNCADNERSWDQLKDTITSKANKYSEIVLYSVVNVTTNQLLRIGANGLHLYVMSKVWTTSIRQVTDFRPNDLLIYMSVNTFPLQKIVMFFKHYTGFPEPIKLMTYSHRNSSNDLLAKSHLFSTQFTNPLVANNNSLVNIAVTFEYLSLLCRYEFSLFKTDLCIDNDMKVKKFNETYWPIKYWSIGAHEPNRSANVLLPHL